MIEQTRNLEIQPETFYRYVDDIFAIFPDQKDIFKFFTSLNLIQSNVKFTYELERNKQLAFLNVNVDNSNDRLELSSYGKPTHTGLYYKWDSLSP